MVSSRCDLLFLNVLRPQPTIWLAVVTTFSMCREKDRSDDNLTPKSLRFCFCSIQELLGDWYWKMGVCSGIPEYLNHSNFPQLNSILILFAQSYIAWRSIWRAEQSPTDLTDLQTLVSSAKDDVEVPVERFDPIHLMWMRNKIGPRTVPCGTPEMTGTSSEILAFYSNSLLSSGWVKEGCNPKSHSAFWTR